MSRWHFSFLSLFLVIILTISSNVGCRAHPSYIFLITLDTTRADHIDYSLTHNSTTPHLAQLAAQGQYFQNAYSIIPITLPSHASMFYSLPPHRLKVYNNGQTQKIPWPSVTQVLRHNGFVTGAVISLGVLKSDFGLRKGFGQYIENFKPHLWTKSAEQVNRDAFDLVRKTVRENTNKNCFFWIHYSDPHEPYFPPYLKGTFFISFNQKRIFAAQFTQQPVINVRVNLSPGNNRLCFQSELPNGFCFKDSSSSNVEVQYIKYQDFSIEPTGDEIFDRNIFKVIFPDEWESNHTSKESNYYSLEKKSEIQIVNLTEKTIPVKLHFIYSLWVDDDSRRKFYKEEIKYMDLQLGKLFDFLKKEELFEESVFVIMGDHGEGLGEYREHFGHIHYLDPGAVQVPFIIAGKGIPIVGRRKELVSNLNIAPTILDIANIQKPKFMMGHSLLSDFPTSKLLLETYSPEAYFDAFSIIDFPYQVCFYPGRVQDKMEFANLLGKSEKNIKKIMDGKKKSAEKLKAELVNSVLKISRIITATKGKIGRVSKRHQEILKSLGYL